MIINKHSSFYIRNGWPTKILLAVRADNHIFSPNAELKAVDELGMGRVMIKALRYWAKALGLTLETKDAQGIVSVETELFTLLYENDRYLQNEASLLLLHRELAVNIEEATAWFWAFNEHSKSTISKEEFVDGFYSYLISNGGVAGKDSVEKEFNCFKNTYVSDGKFDVEKIMEENTIPFFAPVSLLRMIGKDKYEKVKMLAKRIPVDILFYCILNDNAEILKTNRQISIDDMVEKKSQVCRYFNISYGALVEMLQMLENRGKIKLYNNFGNRHIEVIDSNSRGILENYYQSVRR
jgi:hypothetical protein